MKTFKQFQEDYARVINPVKPVTDLIGAGLGAVELGKKTFGGLSNIFQARKKGKYQRKEMKGRVGDQQKINPKLLDAIRKKQKDINTVPSEKPNLDPKKNRITDYGEFQKTKPVDSKTRKRMNAPENQFNSYNPLDEEAPTNNVGGGQIAGTVEAGDDPPVKKKKRYIYGGRGSRKMWMNNK